MEVAVFVGLCLIAVVIGLGKWEDTDRVRKEQDVAARYLRHMRVKVSSLNNQVQKHKSILPGDILAAAVDADKEARQLVSEYDQRIMASGFRRRQNA